MIPDEAVEAAARAAFSLGNDLENWGATPEVVRNRYREEVIRALEAAAPHLMAGELAAVQVEVLTHARAVITQWLSTAEKWRYDQVCADFQEMIDAAQAGELNKQATK